MAAAGAEGDAAHPAEVLAGADDDARLGVGDEVLDLARLVGGVQRQEDMAGAQHAQVQQHRLDRFFGLHRDARALGQAERIQQVGDACARPVHIVPAVRKRPAIGRLNRGGIEVGRKAGTQRDEQVGVVGRAIGSGGRCGGWRGGHACLCTGDRPLSAQARRLLVGGSVRTLAVFGMVCRAVMCQPFSAMRRRVRQALPGQHRQHQIRLATAREWATVPCTNFSWLASTLARSYR